MPAHYISISNANKQPDLDYMATVYNGIDTTAFSLYPIGQPHVVFKLHDCELCQMENQNQSKTEAMRLHIEACGKSGLTIRDYCNQNWIAKSGYYYWLKKLSSEKKSSGFTAISVPKSGSVELPG